MKKLDVRKENLKKEKNGYGVENLKKNEKITCGVIHGVHISLFGGEGSFYPPHLINYTHHLCINCLISTNVTFVSIAYIISNQLLRNTSLTTTT